MKKTILSTAIILALSSASMAYAETQAFDGFYVNAMGGWQNTSVNGSGTTGSNNLGTYLNPAYKITALPNSVQDIASFSNLNSLTGHLGFGFGHVFENHFRLGGEVFLQSSSVSTSKNSASTDSISFINAQNEKLEFSFTTNDQSTFKMNGVEYGIDLMPGYVIGNRQLISGIVGIAVSPSFKVDGTSSGSANLPPKDEGGENILITLPGGSSTASNNPAVGFRLGLNYTYQLSTHWNVLANYVHTFYFGASTTVNTSFNNVEGITETVPNVLTQSVTAKLVSGNEVLVGVSYNF